MWNYEKTGNPVYLNIKETPKQVSEDRPHKKPTLLAIGMHPQLSCLHFLEVMLVRTMTHQMPLHVLTGYTCLTSDWVVLLGWYICHAKRTGDCCMYIYVSSD